MERPDVDAPGTDEADLVKGAAGLVAALLGEHVDEEREHWDRRSCEAGAVVGGGVGQVCCGEAVRLAAGIWSSITNSSINANNPFVKGCHYGLLKLPSQPRTARYSSSPSRLSLAGLE